MQQGQDAENVVLPNVFQLGDWQVQPALGRISAQGQEHKLEPRVMEVLVYLAEHQGEVISRDELERAVWRGALVSYDALTGTIIKLRKALDDRARQPRYIETIPKKGYRLIAAVKLPDADVSAPLDTGPAGEQSLERPPAGGLGHVLDSAAAVRAGRSASGRLVSRLVVLVLVLAAGAWLMLANDAPQVVAPPPLSLPDRPSLAVMPFENLGGDPADDYFSDGMTDDLITDLSQLQGLFVIGRHSAFSYKRDQLDPPAIARDLGVRYLLVGSVRRGGDTLRVNAQLIDAIHGEQLWAERFDDAVDDVFAVQDRINARIVDALALRLSDVETRRIAGTPTTSAPAYDAYLKGMHHFWRGSADDYDEAVRYLQQAIGIDPDFAEAYAALVATVARSWP